MQRAEAPPDAPGARRGFMLATLAICTASQILATEAVLGLAAIGPVVAGALRIPTHWIGYQVSVIYFSGIFASAIAGGLIHRFGAARLNQVTLLATGFGILGLASGQPPTMLAASLLIGVGYGFNNPCSSHMLHRLTPARLRNVVFSVKQAGVPLGGVLAALAMPPLTVALGWRAALLLSALPSLALGTAFGVLRARWDDDRDPGAPVAVSILRGQRIVWRDPGLRALSLIGLFYSAGQLSLSAFTVTMLVSDLGWSPVRAGTVAALVQVCGAAGRIGWGALADLTGAGFGVLGGLGIATAAASVLLWAVPLPTAGEVAVLCALGACSIGWNGVLLAETARLSRHGAGTLTGDVLVYTFIGVVLGPSAFAALFARLGSYAATFAAFSLLGLAGAALALRAMPRDSGPRGAA